MRTARDGVAGSRVAIVGAGPAGSALAVYLGRRGCRVELIEKRPDVRRSRLDGGRSINLGLSARGLRTLGDLGCAERVVARSVRMHGRVIHAVDGSTLFQPYGKDPSEVLHSVTRRDLNAALLDAAEATPGVRLRFGVGCVGVDLDTGRLRLRGEDGGTEVTEADWVVAADGVFSTVRQILHRGQRADLRRDYLDWGYKELTLPQGDDSSAFEWQALHLWPRGESLIVSHANLDRSHTLTLFMPFEGPVSFATLADSDALRAYFRDRFGDLVPRIPDVAEQFAAHPVGELLTLRTSPWHRGGRAVLVGDAAHAVPPFYGQGMNSALEDCLVLDRCLERHPDDRAAAFAAYQADRKPHTDVLADLTARNFVELRSKVRSPLFVARRRADVLLNRLLPRLWLPLYTMVSHTTIPYAQALLRARRQNRLLAALGAGGLLGLGLALGALGRRSIHRRGGRDER